MHFTLIDLLGTFAAFFAFSLLTVIPGFVLGHATDLLQFRSRSLFYRLSISLLVSLSCSPILIYLFARIGGMWLVWTGLSVIWLLFLFLLFSGRAFTGVSLREEARKHRSLMLTAAVLLLLTTLIIIDFGVQDQLYRPLLTYDYTKHASVTAAISRTGVPPVNPSYFPGEPISLFYYYFWFLMCSVVDLIGGSFITPRLAVFGSILWSEVALLMIALFYLKRQGKYLVEGLLPRHYKWGLMLLLVTGLDILPTVGLFLIQKNLGVSEAKVPSIEWWNEQVSSWMSTILWVPHHMVAFVCCMFAFLLINEWFKKNERQQKVYPLVFAVLALASSFGMSIWVTFVAAVILVVWMVFAFYKDRREEIVPLIKIGLATTVLVLPFIIDLQSAQHLERFPIKFTIRPFFILDQVRMDLGEAGTLLLRLLTLPVNYTLELGFFLLGGILYYTYRKSQSREANREEQFMMVVVVTSLLICTFLQSDIMLNDLGWRGFMFAQFGLWIVCLPLLMRCLGKKEYTAFVVEKSVRTVATGLLLLGLSANIYEVVVLKRFAYGEQGAYGYALREAYEWIDETVPETYVIQQNPKTAIEYFHALYGNRQVVLADSTLGRLFGVKEESFFDLDRPIKEIFYSNPTLEHVLDIADTYNIDALIVKREDPLWNDSSSWIWAVQPVYENEFCRVYDLPAISQ